MSIPGTGIDETSPAGSDNISLGDNAIRTHKTQVREIMEVDHEYPSSGQSATAGQHKKITLQEQANLGTGAVSATLLGSQTVGGKGELVYTDEDDVDVQITNGGKIRAESLSGVYPAANVAALATMMNLIYPVGSVYINTSDSTNPGTLLGIGTWVAMVDEVIVGKNSSGTFDTLGSLAVGEETHTLTGGESGTSAHAHAINRGSGAATTNNFFQALTTDLGNNGQTDVSIEANADDAHNNIQPTYVAFMWRRSS